MILWCPCGVDAQKETCRWSSLMLAISVIFQDFPALSFCHFKILHHSYISLSLGAFRHWLPGYTANHDGDQVARVSAPNAKVLVSIPSPARPIGREVLLSGARWHVGTPTSRRWLLFFMLYSVFHSTPPTMLCPSCSWVAEISLFSTWSHLYCI